MRAVTLSLILFGFAVTVAATNEVITTKSRVVLIRDPSAVRGFDIQAAQVPAMVSAGIKSLTGQNDEGAAWRTFVNSNDVVGIKIATQAGPLQSTRMALVDAIVNQLQAAGVATTNIIVWDRYAGKITDAGYGDRPHTEAVIGGSGWDANAFYESKLVGALIWGDLLFGKDERGLSTRSHLPKVLTQKITKLINVPVLLDHDPCGLSGCLYNLSLASVDNSRRFETNNQRGDPYIAEICALPAVRDKLVLNIMDGLIGGYAGGPSFKPQYSWNYGGLYFSRDPVAIDSLCLQLLETKRREAKIPAIGAFASHITTSARLGLGQSDTNKIELIEVKP